MNFKTYTNIKITLEQSILLLELNRPEKFNALNSATLAELYDFLTELKKNISHQIRALILTGAGEKAFIAGADIKEMNQLNNIQAAHFCKLGQDVADAFEDLPIPTIACVNGFALGGGCEMAMACDFIFATPTAVFGQPEVNLGLIPGFGGTQRLKKFVSPSLVKELIFTGRNIPAEEGLTVGLVHKISSTKSQMIDDAKKFLAPIIEKGSYTISLLKEVMTTTDGIALAQALQTERNYFSLAFQSDEKKEGVTAFVEKRKPSFN